MENKFIRVEEVAKELDVSKPYAYKIIRQLNEELKAKGFITIAGRVNRQYFNERLYGAERKELNASFADCDLSLISVGKALSGGCGGSLCPENFYVIHARAA